MLYGHQGALEVEWRRVSAESENCIEPPKTEKDSLSVNDNIRIISRGTTLIQWWNSKMECINRYIVTTGVLKPDFNE